MRICCIVPCFNEAQRLPIKTFLEFLQTNKNFCFLFVDDGSTDNTLELLNKISQNSDKIKVLTLKKNLGKAEAVRQGVLNVNSFFDVDVLGFIDADLSTPLSEIQRLVSNIKGTIKFVLASRFQRIGSNIDRKFYRHYLGRIFATFASLILKLRVYDTQCGAKFFNKEISNILFDKPFITRCGMSTLVGTDLCDKLNL